MLKGSKCESLGEFQANRCNLKLLALTRRNASAAVDKLHSHIRQPAIHTFKAVFYLLPRLHLWPSDDFWHCGLKLRLVVSG